MIQDTYTQKELETIAKEVKEARQTRDFKKFEVEHILNQDKAPLKIGNFKELNAFLKKHDIKNTSDFNAYADRLNIIKIGNVYYQAVAFTRGQY